jgi:hypothetical protein
VELTLSLVLTGKVGERLPESLFLWQVSLWLGVSSAMCFAEEEIKAFVQMDSRPI